MLTDIQGYKFNFYKDKNNQICFLRPFIFIFVYIGFVSFFYYYIVLRKASYVESFIFALFLNSLWDMAYIVMFDKAMHHLPVLTYDMFIVGGVGLTLGKFITDKYYSILKRFIPALVFVYALSMASFLYAAYQYNLN